MIAVERAYIHVNFPRAGGSDDVSSSDVRVQEIAQVLIFAVTGFPQQLEMVERSACGRYRSPDPVGVSVRFLYFDATDVSMIVG